MKISISLLNYNGRPFLQRCIESLERHMDEYPNFEVIIVDNNSTKDNSKSYLRNIKTKLNGQVIYNDENKGFSIANNQASKLATGDIFLLLNNDMITTKGWLKSIVEVFKTEKNVGIVGSRLIHPGKGTIQHAGVVEIKDRRLNHIYFGKPENYPPANIQKEYFAMTGACLATPLKLYKELGGLDEHYWLGWEDIDYNNKVREKGYKIIYAPKSKLYHYESRSDNRYIAETHNFNLYFHTWVHSGRLNKMEGVKNVK